MWSRAFVLAAMNKHGFCPTAAKLNTSEAGHSGQDYPDEPVENRTRFFLKYAQNSSVRLSALLLVLVVCTHRRHQHGFRGRERGFTQKAQWFGDQIGVGRDHIYHLLARAKEQDLLDWERTKRGLHIWITDNRVYQEYNRQFKKAPQGDKHYTPPKPKDIFGHYRPGAAKEVGLNASMVISLLENRCAGDKQQRFSPHRVATCLPWMSVNAARQVLQQLEKDGFIEREPAWRQPDRFAYYWNAEKMCARFKAKPLPNVDKT